LARRLSACRELWFSKARLVSTPIDMLNQSTSNAFSSRIQMIRFRWFDALGLLNKCQFIAASPWALDESQNHLITLWYANPSLVYGIRV
jgi:hypothetical protein